MILTDTGPLVALMDVNDVHYPVCLAFVKTLRHGYLLTPSACFTEAMHLVYRAGGYRLQSDLWRARETGLVVIHESSPAEYDRMQILMKSYQDSPMDLADSAVVAAAEALHTNVVFTVDRHFYAYQTLIGPLQVVPELRR